MKKDEFYKNIDIIDNFIAKRSYKTSDIFAIDNLLQHESYRKYFYKEIKDEALFDVLLKQLKAFDDIPSPKPSKDGKYIETTPWWPGEYLVKVANKIPDKVLNLLQRSETDNRFAIDDFANAILAMPKTYIVDKHEEIIQLFDNWLDSKHMMAIIYREAIALFKKYNELECYEGSIKLLNILSNVIKNRKENSYELVSYMRGVEKHLPKLIDKKPHEVLNAFEKHLKEAIHKDSGDITIDDYSIGWRSTIEDSSQNWEFDEIRNMFLVILRNAIEKLVAVDPNKSREIIERYLNEKFTIFNRLAIHAIRIGNIEDLAKKVLLDRENIDKVEMHHEFFKLMEDKFGLLNINEKKMFINWIIAGPSRDMHDEETDRYRRDWSARRLKLLRSYLEKDEELKEFRLLLDQYKEEMEKITQPDLMVTRTSWKGPTSPITESDIKKMSPNDFIEWSKTNLRDSRQMMGPSPEGVARILEKVVRENPEPFAVATKNLLDEKIWPAYLCGWISGLEGALKSGKTFELKHVIEFTEDQWKFRKEPDVKSKHDVFDIGQYTWVRGAISSFIEALVMKDEIKLSDDLMNRTQKVLIDLIEREKDPTQESEQQYGPDANNMDYVGYCINTNRGKAFSALMQHALRRARMRPEEEKKEEEGKGPFPPGSRMDLYKEYFEKRFSEELSPSVQSNYGRYLPYLYYLDQEWVTKMKKDGKLLPQKNEKKKYWEAHWDGYMLLPDFFNEIYRLLKEDYVKAVDLLKEKESRKIHERYNERLAHHLMLAYWRKLEKLGDKGEIINAFFENASSNLRGDAISFMANSLEEVKPNNDSDEWKRLRILWEYRIKHSKDGELAKFVRWLKYCPENLDDIIHLIKPIIPYLHMIHQEDELYEYIDNKVETNAKSSMELLNQLLIAKESPSGISYCEALIKNVLTKAKDHTDTPGVSIGINQAINRLGELGFYEYKDLLVIDKKGGKAQ